MTLRIHTVLPVFKCPSGFERAARLSLDAMQCAVDEMRRDGRIRARIEIVQHVTDPDTPDHEATLDRIGDLISADRRAIAVIMPPRKVDAARISGRIAGDRVIRFHQNACEGPLSFQLGVGDRAEKIAVAIRWIAEFAAGRPVVIVSGDADATERLAAACGARSVPVPSAADAERVASELRAAGAPETIFVLSAPGALNRTLARGLGAGVRKIFLQGNPDPEDRVGCDGLVEIVGALPIMLGLPLAKLVWLASGTRDPADLETVGMFAWRVDAARLAAVAADRCGLRRTAAEGSGSRLASRLSAFDGAGAIFDGLHRPVWFDAARRNAATETYVAEVDRTGARRLSSTQIVAGPGGLSPRAVLEVDFEFDSIDSVDDAAGRFNADLELSIRSEQPWSHDEDGAPTCLTVVNAEEIAWRRLDGDGDRAAPTTRARYTVRGAFRFSPDLPAYPFDEEQFTLRLTPIGAHASSPIGPPSRLHLGDQCRMPGWTPMGEVGGISVGARLSGFEGEAPLRGYGLEVGLRARRSRRDVAMRVGLPLSLLVAVGIACLVAGGLDRSEMTAGLLGNLFLASIALYFAEPKPAPGTRTVIDAVYFRAFFVFAVLLLGVLSLMRASDDLYRLASMLAAIGLIPLCVVLIASLRLDLGRWRWRRVVHAVRRREA